MTDTATEPSVVRAAAHDATEQARSIAETGKEEATNVMSEVRSQTSHLVGEAGQRARERADTQVGHAARVLGDMSDELDRMAASTQADSPLTTIARDGATAMRSASRRLEDGGLDAALDDVRRFARRRPVVFVTGAFAVGMIAGRLIRNADLGAVQQQIRQDADGTSSTTADAIDTGTMSRVEVGMEPALDQATTDLSVGVEADWDAPTLTGDSGSRYGRAGQPR